MKLICRPVNRSSWHDFETLFESRGCPHYCWCMLWRFTPKEAKRKDPASRKRYLHRRIQRGVPVGILGYVKGEPVAWCSIAPKETYRKLGGEELPVSANETIWSVVCFFIRKDLRGVKLAEQLLAAAVDYARASHATLVEAYPVKRDSPSYRFMGFVSMFRRAGFKSAGRAGTRRQVMRLRLN